MTALRFGSSTDAGRVRGNNEDNLVVAEPLFAVADGMGGHRGGEVASLTAIETLREAFEQHRTADGLVEAARRANTAVWDRAQDDPDLRGMGTTLTAVALVEVDGEQRLVVVNVGDSRAYLLQQGELSRLTEDHSLVEDLVREGQLSADEAATHPQRHILTRVLGMGPDVEPDVWQILPYEGDRLLLCSDGLTNEVSDSEIASVLRRLADPADAARELVRLARAHGGSDNITVVVIDVVDDDDRSLVASRAVAEADGDALAVDGAGAGRAGGSGGGGGRSKGRRVAIPDQAAIPDEADGGEGPVSTLAPPTEEEPGAGDLDVEDAPPHHRLTVRVVAFLVVLMIVLGGGAGAVGWYARNSWFVGLRANRVTIFQGRPSGLLWFHPSVRQTTSLTTESVLPARLDDLRRGKEEPSLLAARRYVANLGQEAAAAGLAPPAPAGPAGVAPTTTAPGARPALLAGRAST